MTSRIFLKFKEVKKNPFHSRLSLSKAYKYKNKLYKKIFNSLVSKMNNIHAVNYPKKYWELIFSSWLNYFLISSLVAWLQVKKIKYSKKVYNLPINYKYIYFQDFLEITKNYSEESKKYTNYKNFIYSKIFKYFKIKYNISKIHIDNIEYDKKFSFKKFLFTFFIHIRNIVSLKKIIFMNLNYDICKMKLFCDRDLFFFQKNLILKKIT